MAGRASVFSDPDVIDLIATQFIPVAENSSLLQTQPDDKGEFFRHVVEQGHYGGRTQPTGTRQGSYVFTADGRFLNSINSRNPEIMIGMMRTALDRLESGYVGIGPAAVQLTGTVTPSSGFPEDGLVLNVVARDLPREEDSRRDDWRRTAWNQDYAWIWEDEARSLVPGKVMVGESRTWPEAVVRRLARFHLRDFVRGEPFAWPAEAVHEASITSRVVDVQGDTVRLAFDGVVRLEWEAHFRADSEAQVKVTRPDDDGERHIPCGFTAAITGEGTWDRGLGRFTFFDVLAAGPRWGANKYNSREDDLGPASLGIALGLAGTTPAERTPPHVVRISNMAGDQPRASRFVVDLGAYRD